MAIERRIAEVLESANIPFEAEVAVGGLRPDFLVTLADGPSIVVEAKRWKPTPENRARAIQQAQLYKKATGATHALVVLEGLKRGEPAKGLVSETELLDVINTISEQKGKGQPAVATTTQKVIFAAMPFSGEYDDVYLVAMAYAAEAVSATVKRVDYEDYQGDVVEEIKQLIRRCIAVIADLSEAKPNVLYETGFAHALQRPTVHICSTPLEQLPFDVRNWNTMKYSKGQTHRLKEPLAKSLKAIVGSQG